MGDDGVQSNIFVCLASFLSSLLRDKVGSHLVETILKVSFLFQIISIISTENLRSF
jgi:uncharacterized protein YqhQ